MEKKDNQIKPEVLVLVGLPGSGKSTWAQAHSSNYEIASTDRFIREHAAREGKNYGDVFREFAPRARAMMKETVEGFIAARKPFIWDQTNLLKVEREGIYNLMHKTHTVTFVAFIVPLDICRRNNAARGEKTGQRITEDHFMKIVRSATFPRDSELHDKIIRIIHPEWKGKVPV